MNNAADRAAGLLLVVHGTRDIAGLTEARRALAMISERLAPRPVELGFLELAEPSIAEAVGRLVGRGVRRLTVAPLMLFAAAHVKQDIPRMVDASLGAARLDLVYADPLDCHSAVLEVSAARLAEQTDPQDLTDTLLLLVGRGGGDAEAIDRFGEFAHLRQQLAPAAEVRVCYLAVAKPSFDEAITGAGTISQRRIVVQPHLLYHGQLMRRLRQRIARCQDDDSARKWLLCQHLGPDERIAGAVIDRMAEAECGMDVNG